MLVSKSLYHPSMSLEALRCYPSQSQLDGAKVPEGCVVCLQTQLENDLV